MSRSNDFGAQMRIRVAKGIDARIAEQLPVELPIQELASGYWISFLRKRNYGPAAPTQTITSGRGDYA
jgi:hypothetical protein